MLDEAESRLALQWREGGSAVAVAVVVTTWGSAPRPVGSRLYVREGGDFAGSVSGGCVEKEVILAAQETIKNGGAQVLAFGVADELAWENGLSCGGEIKILLYALDDGNAKCLREALENLANRNDCILLTDTTDGSQRLSFTLRGGVPPFTYEEGAVFEEHFTPPPRLMIVGATHITQHLLALARQLGYAHIVIDPRAHWATEQRFLDAKLLVAYPDDVMGDMEMDRGDAVITVTHDPKIDDPALLAALAATPFYIGALGSTRTHAKRCARLQEAGADEAALTRIRAPIGLRIGAQGAAEIALSIMAEVSAAYRGAGADMR